MSSLSVTYQLIWVIFLIISNFMLELLKKQFFPLNSFPEFIRISTYQGIKYLGIQKSPFYLTIIHNLKF